MNSVLEIKIAPRQWPAPKRLRIAAWLPEDLPEGILSHAEGGGPGDNGGRTFPQSDYATRHRIFMQT